MIERYKKEGITNTYRIQQWDNYYLITRLNSTRLEQRISGCYSQGYSSDCEATRGPYHHERQRLCTTRWAYMGQGFIDLLDGNFEQTMGLFRQTKSE